ncbi:MAG: Flp pilus assembly complex ATPase component TadA [Planctomycetes bacterium]|nr:Flp pilus assembly complex ATPase component TadA [Planctomycetota bacterium]
MHSTILQRLSEAASLTEDRVREIQKLEAETGQTADRLVLQKGYLSEAEILKILADVMGYEYRGDLRDENVPKDFVDAVPVQYARNYNLVGLGLTEDGSARVACCAPLDVHPIDELSTMIGRELDVVLAPKAEITSLVNRAYKAKSDVVGEALTDIGTEDINSLAAEVEEGEDLLNVANKAPIIKLVNMILFNALKMRASDVHLQPKPDRLQIRFRVDGILYDMESAPKKVQEAIISRIKIMAKMDIAERRLPQDGRASLRLGEGEVDVRVSSVPTSSGERIVLRLLDKSTKVYRLAEIGMEQDSLEIFRKYIQYTHGIILVTGPTGSGKTTTLYAAMSEMNATEKNILTIEDPIEYNLDGVSQVQVNVKKGLTFAAGLRSFLRQDPDVMFVGEIRDRETAEISIRAALTGHLVFSTVHTNDSPSSVTRLLDIGIEPYLVSSSVLLVIAQRLVRLICPKCKMWVTPDSVLSKKLVDSGIKLDKLKDGKVAVGKGCDYCFNSGYVDRTAIYEMLPIDDVMKDQIMDRSSATVIKRSAMERGALNTLRMDGLAKVVRGMTTIDEVMRVTQLDGA